MSWPVTEEDNTGLIWEIQLALWLPRPLLFGAFLIAACFGAAYLSFQWLFDLHVEGIPIGFGLMIACILMAPRYLASLSASGRLGNVLKIRPPLVFTQEQVNLLIETLDRVLP